MIEVDAHTKRFAVASYALLTVTKNCHVQHTRTLTQTNKIDKGSCRISTDSRVKVRVYNAEDVIA